MIVFHLISILYTDTTVIFIKNSDENDIFYKHYTNQVKYHHSSMALGLREMNGLQLQESKLSKKYLSETSFKKMLT